MKALFRDQSDDTLFAAEIRTVTYDPDTKILLFISTDDDDIEIPQIERGWADGIIQTLYEDNKINLTEYPAYLNEEAPEASECDGEVEEPRKSIFASLFRADSNAKSGDPWDN